jgi:hypothetical protein
MLDNQVNWSLFEISQKCVQPGKKLINSLNEVFALHSIIWMWSISECYSYYPRGRTTMPWLCIFYRSHFLTEGLNKKCNKIGGFFHGLLTPSPFGEKLLRKLFNCLEMTVIGSSWFGMSFVWYSVTNLL